MQGLEAHHVTVEVDLAPGLPGIQLLGLPDKAIQESRKRVRSALCNSGFRGPLVRVAINLAPADLRKEGPALDLPIALGLRWWPVASWSNHCRCSCIARSRHRTTAALRRPCWGAEATQDRGN